MHLLRNLLEVDKPFEYKVVDEYSKEASNPTEKFPLIYKIDYDKQVLYFFEIDESFVTSK